MQRTCYLHRDVALMMLGMMPARRQGETDNSYQRRKAKAATRLERRHNLRAYIVDGARARRYREDEVFALAERIIKPAA